MNKIYLVFISCAIILLGCSETNKQDTSMKSAGDVTYKITFNATWSAATHPDGFPSNPHFSGLIGATHNINASFWQEGEIASQGIESMAEVGSKFTLRQEIESSINVGDSNTIISESDLSLSPGSLSFNLPVNVNYSFVSLVSMIAPSPDWFVGISGLNLMENGIWVDSKTIDLYVFDSGTDDGINYNSPDANSNPKQLITRIVTSPFFVDGEVKPVGQITFSKM